LGTFAWRLPPSRSPAPTFLPTSGRSACQSVVTQATLVTSRDVLTVGCGHYSPEGLVVRRCAWSAQLPLSVLTDLKSRLIWEPCPRAQSVRIDANRSGTPVNQQVRYGLAWGPMLAASTFSACLRGDSLRLWSGAPSTATTISRGLQLSR